jgi:hypothetical protein
MQFEQSSSCENFREWHIIDVKMMVFERKNHKIADILKGIK